ncbi:MAG: heavy metal-responsive transcriptional regulator [Acidobacteriia bacterium]|nr:heavy metal-responsive transcriptional regulator [Terriglobia bacterium]
MTGPSTRTGFFSIGELARAVGVSPDILRHYERKGVLAKPIRLPNRYRRFPASVLERVRLVRRALALGFTLDELARILNVRDRGGAPCRQARDLAARKLSEIEQRFREMRILRREFRTLLKDWDRRLAKTPTRRAYLLETLTAKKKIRPLGASRSTFLMLQNSKRRKQ